MQQIPRDHGRKEGIIRVAVAGLLAARADRDHYRRHRRSGLGTVSI